MARVSMKEARDRLRELVELAQAGEEVMILRRGREVARLVAPERSAPVFPDLSEFRASIELLGEPASETVIALRRDARF
jgi:prevent-host-death family protein